MWVKVGHQHKPWPGQKVGQANGHGPNAGDGSAAHGVEIGGMGQMGGLGWVGWGQDGIGMVGGMGGEMNGTNGGGDESGMEAVWGW